MTEKLRQAIAEALLGQQRGVPPECPPPVEAGTLRTPEVSPGAMVGNVDVRPVKPGHPYEPGPKQFTVVGPVCYVRQADWPALEAALQKQRAAKQSQIMQLAPIEVGGADD